MRKKLAKHHHQIEDHGEVHAIEQRQRQEPSPVVSDTSGICGFSWRTRMVRYAAPSAPASSEFVSIRRNRIA